MTTITTTLTWREDALYAGAVYIGHIEHQPDAMNQSMQWQAYLVLADDGTEHATEAEARSALEQAAVSALTDAHKATPGDRT